MSFFIPSGSIDIAQKYIKLICIQLHPLYVLEKIAKINPRSCIEKCESARLVHEAREMRMIRRNGTKAVTTTFTLKNKSWNF
jgi:hypothetical protein